MGTNPSYRGMFRGFGFAAVRDMISQGIPFVFAKPFEENIVKPMFPGKENNGMVSFITHWGSVFTCSVLATVASQGLHNCQITMQSNPDLNHLTAVNKAFKENGVRILWRGAEARVGLLLVVNFLNEVLLKKAWQQVPADD